MGAWGGVGHRRFEQLLRDFTSSMAFRSSPWLRGEPQDARRHVRPWVIWNRCRWWNFYKVLVSQKPLNGNSRKRVSGWLNFADFWEAGMRIVVPAVTRVEGNFNFLVKPWILNELRSCRCVLGKRNYFFTTTTSCRSPELEAGISIRNKSFTSTPALASVRPATNSDFWVAKCWSFWSNVSWK